MKDRPEASVMRWWAIMFVHEERAVGFLIAPGDDFGAALRGAASWNVVPRWDGLGVSGVGPFGLVDVERLYGDIEPCVFHSMGED